MQLAQYRDQWRALVNTVKNRSGEFFDSLSDNFEEDPAPYS